MKIIMFLVLFSMTHVIGGFSQSGASLIANEDLAYLKELTRVVVDSSRIRPGQLLPAPFGANNTGGTLIRPGARATYPSFWIRDYAMSLETGFVTKEEQKHMLLLTASTQCDQTWITKGGSMVPYGAIADHIRVENSAPVYFAGTYDVMEQGTEEFGIFPPYCDQFYFIAMANHYAKTTGDVQLLRKEVNGMRVIDRLEIAFRVPPAHADNHIVFNSHHFRAVDFGFRDAIRITGDLLYPSLLKYRAALDLAELFDRFKSPNKAAVYRGIAQKIKDAIPTIFTAANGMLKASTGTSAQPDVWGTSLAIYEGILSEQATKKASRTLANAYKKGSLTYKGNIRHIIKEDDFSGKTSWEGAISITPINQYQNGAYWGTPVGWVANAIAETEIGYARQLVSEYITDLRETDFRKGGDNIGPVECFFPPSYKRGPIYLTTVSCPYIVLKKMGDKQ